MKILFATPECAPMAKTGGLGDVSAALPVALAALGHDVKVLMPGYGGMKAQGEFVSNVGIPAAGPWPSAQLVEVRTGQGVGLLFLMCPDYYARAGGPYADPAGHDFPDNAQRFGFLAYVAALIGSSASPLQWKADVVHANDWPCGLAPLYLRQMASSGETVARSVMTIHNIAFQGVFPMPYCDRLQVADAYRGVDGVEFWGQMSMLKAGLQFANAITTVSPTYAREIQTPSGGLGLDGVLRARASVLHGILNGIDTNVWNPNSDQLIAQRYDASHLEAKKINKAALQAHCGLQPDHRRMLFGMVSRLTSQKGVDLVVAAANHIVHSGGQLVVLGTGDAQLQAALDAVQARHPAHASVTIGFDETLAHGIEAGADCFLMPSRFEPCGLNQLYSMAYGTPPVLSAVGGLADSVTDADAVPAAGTGFVMAEVDEASFFDALNRAMTAWQDTPRWACIQRNGMGRPSGWELPAQAYLRVFESDQPTFGNRSSNLSSVIG